MTTLSIPQIAIRIKNEQTHRFLYDNLSSGLISWQESTNPDAYWYITPITDKVHKIKNRQTGNCIYYNIDLRKPLTWQDTANEDGKWELVAVTDKSFKIRNILTPYIFLFDNPSNGVIGFPDNGNSDGIWSVVI